MRTVRDLTRAELNELKEALFYELVDIGDDIISQIDTWEDIPDCIVINHNEGIMFVADDFWCNQ